MKVKEESENFGLNLNIQNTKISTSSPITSWQIDGKQWKQWQALFWGAPKSLYIVIAAMKLKDPCSLEEKLDPLERILKSWDITLPIKVCIVKAMIFPLVMDRCECWTIKKALINWCFWAMVLDKTFESPLDCRRSNQSILKKTNPEYPLEGLMLKLKLQYFGYLLQRVDSLEKTMMLGKIEGGRRGWQRWDGWMASPTQWMWIWANSWRWWTTGNLACCSPWVTKSCTQGATEQ